MFSKTKGFFCFRSTKDLQRMPLGKLTESLCIRYFLKTKPETKESITEQCFSCQNNSVCQKLARSCTKWKSVKNLIDAFLHKGLQLKQLNKILMCLSLLTDLLAISTNTGSSFFLPRNSGQYPITAIPFSVQWFTMSSNCQKGFNSIWLTAGVGRPAFSISLRWCTPKLDTPADLESWKRKNNVIQIEFSMPYAY